MIQWLTAISLLVSSSPKQTVAIFPEKLSQTAIYQDIENKVLDPKFVSFEVNHSLWADCSKKARWIYVPEKMQIQPNPENTESWNFPVGTVIIKNFTFDYREKADQLLETRLAINTAEGWKFQSYHWNQEQTEADRIDEQKDVTLTDLLPNERCMNTELVWTLPDTNRCSLCHGNDVAKPLAMKTSQLNHGQQILNWQTRGWIAELPDLSQPTHKAIEDITASLEEKARSYLDVQCATCHSPGGIAPGGVDFRKKTPLDATNTVYVMDSNIYEGEMMFRIQPGSAQLSTLIYRMESTSEYHMPLVGSRIPDALAIDALKQWINSL
jgi:uncharacterized repeat protein (TIGR03806 family)